MNRRDLLILLGGAVAALRPMAAGGQSKVFRVGVLGDSTPELWQVFTDALRARGWVEGQGLVFDIRSSEGQPERYQLASDLVAHRPDLVVAVTYQNAKALQQSTKTV